MSMAMTTTDLRHHGDRDAAPGLIDFAVNVRLEQPPDWLQQAIAASLGDLARYPDATAARAAVAARHGHAPDEVLLTAGAAEAFVLIARALNPRHAVVVHPQFTEPEAALRAAGHAVDRVILRPENGFTLDAHDIPPAADLVMIGNPTNPTSTLHPAATLEALARPGRTLVVDEAFMDAVPGEVESVSARSDLPGLLVIRSLTKTWALAGLRIGYLLGDPLVLATLRNAQPLWAVSSPALIAAAACSTPTAVRAAEQVAIEVAGDREYLVAQLARIGIAVAGKPAAPFVLIRVDDGERLQLALRDRGIAIRSAGTFPGLDSNWLRIAVRTPELIDHLIEEIDNLK
jgi:histidinol-phosphate aminotransferase